MLNYEGNIKRLLRFLTDVAMSNRLGMRVSHGDR